MMRSLYSGVSGLKTHQTKMDVIGNNIANVNTVAFKSSNTTFNEIMYQNLSNASGASAGGRGGVNAKQIGLGVAMGSTYLNITTPGASQTTGDAFDIKINGDSFFVVNNGNTNYFTKAGAFYIDGAGNLAMKTTGYTVMGWQVDPNTGNIQKDSVSALRIMQEKNLTSAPEATVQGVCGGNLDKNNTNLNSDGGYIMNLNFYDALGFNYTAQFAVKGDKDSINNGTYMVELTDIFDTNGKSVLDTYLAANPGSSKVDLFGENKQRDLLYEVNTAGGYTYTGTGYAYNGTPLTWNPAEGCYYANAVKVELTSLFSGLTPKAAEAIRNNTGVATDPANGSVTFTEDVYAYTLDFNTKDGTFNFINNAGNVSAMLNLAVLGDNFADIDIDFSQTKWQAGSSTMDMTKGATDGMTGTGKKLGDLIGLSVSNDGTIWGSYDNGNTVLLGQIAVAVFPNPSGLEKLGENCYQTTLNSGEFDGIGQEVSADGSSMTSGVLEMSNVDLSTEFTEMITTQRGFQANSRIITTSDSLLEELVNLKR